MAFISNDAKKMLKDVANSQILGNQNQPQEEQGQDLLNSGGSQPVSASQGLGGAQPFQQSTNASGPTNTKAPASGMFTNINKYVDKNKTASDRMSGAVQQGLQTAADVAKRNVQQTGQQFTGEVDKGSLANRDIAQEQVRGTALQAAGGIQDPNAEKNRVAAQQAAYAEQVNSLNPTIQSQQAAQTDLQNKQKDYESYQAALTKSQNVKNAVDAYMAAISDARRKNKYQHSVQITSDNLQRALAGNNNPHQLEDMERKIAGTPNYNREALYQKLGGAEGYTKAIMNAYGFGDTYYKDALSNVYNQPKPNTSGSFIQDISVNPKYRDVSKEIEEVNLNLGKTQAQQKAAQGLSTFVPKAVDVPAILAQASSQGPVSDERVKEILNAMYKGPTALHDIKGYDKTLQNVNKAERRLGQVSKKGVSGDLLQDLFRSPERDYSRGERTLDSAILGQSGKLDSLLGAKKNIGSVADYLTNKEAEARGQAGTRASEINTIREASKGTLQDIAGARSGQVEQRLQNVVTDWEKLPQYMRDVITNSMKSNNGTAILSAAEAGLLGVQSGEGLYNAIKDLGVNKAIASSTADKNKLVSKAEQSQLQRLQELSQLGDSYNTMGDKLNFANKYTDAEKAGTQSASDSLDTKAIRDMLVAREKKFGTDVNKTISGTGIGGADYSDWKGKTKNKTERANLSANMKDVLTKAGYNFDKKTGYDDISDKTLAPALLKSLSGPLSDSTSNMSAEAATLLRGLGGSFLGRDSMGDIGKFSEDPFINTEKLYNKLKGLDVLGLSSPIDKAGKIFGFPSVGGLMGGLTGSSKAKSVDLAYQRALQAANKDVLKNTQTELNNMGFNNRFKINNNDKSTYERLPELVKILAGMDLTNTVPADNQTVQTPVNNSVDDILKKIMGSNLK